MRREQAGLRGISGDSERKVACLRAGKRRIRYRTPASCKNREAGLGKNPPLRLARCKGESAGRVEKPGENRREEWRGNTNDKGEIMPAGVKEGRWGEKGPGLGQHCCRLGTRLRRRLGAVWVSQGLGARRFWRVRVHLTQLSGVFSIERD